MKLSVILIVIAVLFGSCGQHKDKLMYYEQHDDCKVMKILETAGTVKDIEFTNDPNTTLAAAIKIHHKCAMEMAGYELSNGSNKEVRRVAEKMIQKDSAEITMIDTFVEHYKARNGNSKINGTDVGVEIRRAFDKMHHSADLQLIKDDNDRDYSILVLPLRQCNLDLSEIAIHNATEPFLKELAMEIQQNEPLNVELLQLWVLRYSAGHTTHQ